MSWGLFVLFLFFSIEIQAFRTDRYCKMFSYFSSKLLGLTDCEICLSIYFSSALHLLCLSQYVSKLSPMRSCLAVYMSAFTGVKATTPNLLTVCSHFLIR